MCSQKLVSLAAFIDTPKCETIGTKIKDLKNIELNTLPVYDVEYKNKTKRITYIDKICYILCFKCSRRIFYSHFGLIFTYFLEPMFL